MKTKIISVKEKNAVQITANALKKGKIIVCPTETSYGIGCRSNNTAAIRKIHRIKKEPATKPLIILVSSLNAAKKIGKITKVDAKLVKKFMPGPLTLVVEKKTGQNTVAFRISSNKFVLALCKTLGTGLVSTSANIHGKNPVLSVKKIIEAFDGKIDLLVDAGTLPKKMASTVYDSKSKKIIRKGKIILKKLKKYSEKQ